MLRDDRTTAAATTTTTKTPQARSMSLLVTRVSIGDEVRSRSRTMNTTTAAQGGVLEVAPGQRVTCQTGVDTLITDHGDNGVGGGDGVCDSNGGGGNGDGGGGDDNDNDNARRR